MLSKALALLLVVWIVSILIAGDKCTRVQRFALPVSYLFDFVVSPVTVNWVSPDTRLFLLQTQLDLTLGAQRMFEKVAYGIKTYTDKDGVAREYYVCTTSGRR